MVTGLGRDKYHRLWGNISGIPMVGVTEPVDFSPITRYNCKHIMSDAEGTGPRMRPAT